MRQLLMMYAVQRAIDYVSTFSVRHTSIPLEYEMFYGSLFCKKHVCEIM